MVRLLDLLAAERVVAILRGSSAAHACRAAEVIAGAGVRLLEVSLTTPDALAAIAELTASLPPGCLVGAGTVLTAADAEAAAGAGAAFLVTPAVTPSVRRGVELGVPVLAGALTPTEIWTAMDAGAAAIKLFPASFGGVAHLAALRQPLPGVPFVPVGGVDRDAADAYLAAGAVAVGVGSPLVGRAAEDGDLAGLAARAASFAALRVAP